MPYASAPDDPLRPPPPRRIGWRVVVVLIGVLAVLGYVNRQRLQQLTQAWFGHPVAGQVAASAPAAPAPRPGADGSAPQPAASVASAPLQIPVSTASLPALHDSDPLVLRELAALLTKPGMDWLVPHRLIVHFVATVDNLGRQTVQLQVWPVRPLPGMLRVTGQGDTLAIAPANAQRYVPYVKLLTAIEPQRAAQVYVRLYPLCEQAWRELGHPNSAFNDRLLAVLGSLLRAPEPQGLVLLRQPKVAYTYADAALEAAPAGQKILMRMGLENERAVKDWLSRFRQALLAQLRPAASAPAQ
ncbi:DUF3014 domain-containing protein [Thiomonas sp.]|uniref:DUF3014 domain-containing protein n=1 Tax=Thiomonas sp. TaxID=2047785 RepID=UPI002629E718|nr:DUF3014 domain-containing protein [Thiomonas sp.]